MAMKRRWTRFDQYLFSEIHMPFFLAMLVYNGILFIRTFTQVAQTSGEVDIPLWLFLAMFSSYVPEILYYTMPMSFLFAAIAAIARMSSDSELMAPFSAGMSFWRLNRPVFVYGFMLTAIAFALANWVEPVMIQYRYFKYQQFMQQVAKPTLDTGVINTLNKKSIFYMDRIEGDHAADLIYISQNGTNEHMTYADEIEIVRDSRGRFRIKLTDGNEKILDLNHTEGPKIARFNKLNMAFPTLTASSSAIKGEVQDSATTWQLIPLLLQAEGRQRIEMEIELCERMFFPLACILLSLFPVPLAAQHSRLRRSSGFGLSLGLIAMYFLVAKLATDRVENGELHAVVGVGLPSIIYLVVGIFMQWSKATWIHQTLTARKDRLVTGIKRFLKALKPKQRTRDTGQWRTNHGKPFQPIQFPRRIDLYIIRQFLSTFLLIQGSVLSLVILGEYTQIASWAQKNQIPNPVVLRYLLYRIPELLDMTVFFCLLITVLVVFAVMSKNREITAIRASGGSLQRLCLPLILIGVGFSAFSFYTANSFLPAANRIAFSLRSQIKNSKPGKIQKNWLRTSDGGFLNFDVFSQSNALMHGATVYDADFEHGGITRRSEYPRLAYIGGLSWRTEEPARIWEFVPDPQDPRAQVPVPRQLPAGSVVEINVDYRDLAQRERRPSEFGILELRSYIAYLKGLGISPTKFETELFVKMAQPLLPLIMMLLAMPLGFQFGRRGTFYGVGLGLSVGLAFWLLFELMRQLGYTGALPPSIAAWSSVVIFGVAATFRFIQMEQ